MTLSREEERERENSITLVSVAMVTIAMESKEGTSVGDFIEVADAFSQQGYVGGRGGVFLLVGNYRSMTYRQEGRIHVVCTVLNLG